MKSKVKEMRESEMTAGKECVGCPWASIRIYRNLPRELIEGQHWKRCGHKQFASNKSYSGWGIIIVKYGLGKLNNI